MSPDLDASYPLYDSAFNEISKLEDQTLHYIHSRMVTACGKTKRIIQSMHAKQTGSATVAAAVPQVTPTTTPTPPPPPSQGKSLNNKAHMPNCQQYMTMRRCSMGHKNFPYNHPELPRLSKEDWDALQKKYPKPKKKQQPRRRQNKQQFYGNPHRKIPNRICNYILHDGRPCPYAWR